MKLKEFLKRSLKRSLTGSPLPHGRGLGVGLLGVGLQAAAVVAVGLWTMYMAAVLQGGAR